jgi:hypothetical protein
MSRSTTCPPHSICRCDLPLGDGVANFFPMTGGAVPSFILKIRSDRSEKLDCGGRVSVYRWPELEIVAELVYCVALLEERQGSVGVVF